MKITLKHVLVPTDFSDTSEVALRYGCALCEAFGGELHLLHVLESPMILPPGAEGYVAVPDFADLQKAANERLAKAISADWRQKLAVQTLIRQGSPFVEIVRYAKDVPIDLIVMGTHGRGPIAHMLLGSVAEKVVRKAPCPVLTVRHPEHEFVRP